MILVHAILVSGQAAKSLESPVVPAGPVFARAGRLPRKIGLATSGCRDGKHGRVAH